MTWFGYVLIATCVLNVALTIGQIGKPRRPIDRSTAVGSLVVNALYVWALATIGTNG